MVITSKSASSDKKESLSPWFFQNNVFHIYHEIKINFDSPHGHLKHAISYCPIDVWWWLLCPGSRSARAKPLHWTSCLKIAEDVAHGLAYIHQVSSLIHGNLKSSNVLLGVDFEACITDYCLALFADSSFSEDPDSAAYKAPEARSSSHKCTAKSDVYAFGVLLIELLTGKHPSQHPFLAPADLQDWVRAMRDDDGSEDNRLEMLTEVASICSATSPEQRPVMWQVLKMIQGIKDSATMEDTALTWLT